MSENNRVRIIKEAVRRALVESRPEGIMNQRKGAKSASGVSYDDIKKVKTHFKSHDFHIQAGAKMKDGTHRLTFVHHERDEPHSDSGRLEKFNRAAKTSPVELHRHGTSPDKIFGTVYTVHLKAKD